MNARAARARGRRVGGKGKAIVIGALAVLVCSAAVAYKFRWELAPYRYLALGYDNHFVRPEIQWPSVAPQQEGMSEAKLKALSNALFSEGTDAFIVVRGGKIVFERYSFDTGPNTRMSLASMAKGVVADSVVMKLVSDGQLDPKTLATDYIPQWKRDKRKSLISIRNLLDHTSGLTDVDFYKGASGKLVGWKRKYYKNPDKRFDYALELSPVQFMPGSRQSYCGLGYYVLADVVTRVLSKTTEPTILDYIRKEVWKPLGIPPDSCVLSYGKGHKEDGMEYYAFGSGASCTARAVARIGEAVLESEEGRRGSLFNETVAERFLRPTRDFEDSGRSASDEEPVYAVAWATNRYGQWKKVPRDALVAEGGGDRLVLIIPSEDLVAVRLGHRPLATTLPYWQIVDEDFLTPVSEAVTGTVEGSASQH